VISFAGPGRTARPGHPRPGASPGHGGYSLVELMLVLGVAATVAAIAIPQSRWALDEARTLGAVRYLTSRIHQARMEAVTRSHSAGLRFIPSGDSFSYAVYADGNRNGLRAADIADGIDAWLDPPERLSDLFAGVDFGAVPGLPSVDPSAPPPGDDPIRLGAGNMLTFSAIGTATAGSLYVRGPRSAQYVIRIFGETGRTRALKFDARSRSWRPL
jgi:prepilin-type N-terminal cleavage/methylation domain-containing protein